jgi:hypothetical protein
MRFGNALEMVGDAVKAGGSWPRARQSGHFMIGDKPSKAFIRSIAFSTSLSFLV